MTSKKRIIIFCTIVFGFLFFDFLSYVGVREPQIYQEKLSDLKREEGLLQLTHYLRANYYYIEMENGKKLRLKFVSLAKSKFSSYEGKYVTVWRKGRYVYQMEIDGKVIFSINEANDEVFHYNYNRVIFDLLWLLVVLTGMCMAIYTKNF